MLADLFSQFDPRVRSLFKFSSLLFWAFSFSPFFVLTLPSLFIYLSGCSFSSRFGLGSANKIFSEMGVGNVQRVSNVLFSTFFLILGVNLLGLFPGRFRVSRHFLFSMSLGVPLWFALLLIRFSKYPVTKLGGYIGSGIPVVLGPPIGACEIIRTVIRPLALGLRLAANILAGHVITSLVANCLVYVFLSGSTRAFVFGVVSFGLFLFEGAVCIIQAYVFILLLRVYLQEYPI